MASTNDYIKIRNSSNDLIYDAFIIRMTNNYYFVKKLRNNIYNKYYLVDTNKTNEELEQSYDNEFKKNDYFIYGRYNKRFANLDEDLDDNSIIKIYIGQVIK